VKKIKLFFQKKITIARWQFNLFGLACFFAGLSWGAYLLMSGALSKSLAAGGSPILKTSSTDFSQGVLSANVNVDGTGSAGKVVLKKVVGPNTNPNYQSDISATPGLVSYWKMDNDFSDSKGSNNPFEEFTTAKNGSGAGNFNGTSRYINLGNDPSLNIEQDSFTIETWFKLNDNSSDQNIYTSSLVDGQGAFLTVNRFGGNNISLSKAGIVDQIVDYTFDVGSWYHLVVVSNFSAGSPSDVEYFVNGVSIGSFADSTDFLSSDGATHAIAGARFYPESGLHPINGTIDEFALYNTALDADTINSHYNSSDYQADIESTPGLVSYWKMDGDWADAVGPNGGTAMPTAPSFGLAKYGSKSARFNGVNETIIIPGSSSLNLSNQLSLEGWAKFLGSSTGNEMIVDKINGENLQYGLGRYSAANDPSVAHHAYFSMNINGAGWNDYVVSNAVLDDNKWYHIVGTYDGSKANLYIDGQLDNSVDVSGTLNGNSDGDVWIGADDYNHVGGTEFTNAFIDEVGVYNMALNDVDVLNHYAGNYAATGTWDSPIDQNVIDLLWNGGWGDGSDGSAAFSADVAGLGGASNSKITFSMRVADSVVNLDAKSFVDIGIASSSSTNYVVTKAQVEAALGSLVSTDRFVQIKATFLQNVNATTTPELKSFQINYVSDDIPPAANASNVSMKKDASAVSNINSNDWTNNVAPYFAWSGGNDAESGIKGYCLYLGSDIAGNPGATSGGGSKGLLGTSPVSIAGTGCQFIVATEFVDFANVALRGSIWLTSSADPYYLNIKAIDKNNNVYGGAPLQFQFRFDNQVPRNVSYVSLPSNFISNPVGTTMSWPTIGINDIAKDNISGLLGLQYKIGTDPVWHGTQISADPSIGNYLLFSDGVYNFTDQDFATVQNGAHFVYVRAVDVAGNFSTTVSGVVKINKDAPATPNNLSVNPVDNSNKNEYTFSWSAPDLIGSQNAANFSYCYTINTPPSATTCDYTPKATLSIGPNSFASRPGENIFYVVAKDNDNGNINYETFAQISFFYSGSAPEKPRNIDISDISIKATSNWKLALSWDEPSYLGAGINEYKIFRSDKKGDCIINPDYFSEIGSTQGTSYVSTGLSQKEYYYCVSACDSANNCGLQSSTVSKIPTGKFTSPSDMIDEPNVSMVTTSKATIKWSTNRVSDSKISYGKDSRDYYKEEPSNSEQVTSHEIALNNLSPGTQYFYRAKWTDGDGNTGTSSEKSFETEPAPKIKDTVVSDIGISSASIKFTSKGASKVKMYYGTTSDFGSFKEVSVSKSETSYNILLSGLNDDTKYYYQLNTFDVDGQEYEGTTLDFTTLPRPRIFNVQIEQIKDSVQPGVHVVWSSNTEISSIVSYNPTDNPAEKKNDVQVDFVSGEHEATIMNLKPMLAYSLVVRGNDRSGNQAVSDTYSFTTASDTRPPKISEIVVEGTSTNNPADKLSQLAVSWNTDEAATSQVEFGEGVGTSYTQRTQEDANFTSNHLVVISGLTPSKVYHLRIVSKDPAGNIANSQDTVSITPKAIDSAFELVIGSLTEVFGFLKGFRN